MTIVRSPRVTSHFTTFRNDVIRDKRLSYRATGVLLDILSRPDNWRTDSVTLARSRGKEGRDAIRKALSELQKAGYVERRTVRDQLGRIKTISYIYDEPQQNWTSPEPEKPAAGEPVAGKPGALRSTDTKNPEEETKTNTPSTAEAVEAATATHRSRDGGTVQKRADKDEQQARHTLSLNGITDEEANILVDYLRHRTPHIGSLAAFTRHITQHGPTGAAENLDRAWDWREQQVA